MNDTDVFDALTDLMAGVKLPTLVEAIVARRSFPATATEGGLLRSGSCSRLPDLR